MPLVTLQPLSYVLLLHVVALVCVAVIEVHPINAEVGRHRPHDAGVSISIHGVISAEKPHELLRRESVVLTPSGKHLLRRSLTAEPQKTFARGAEFSAARTLDLVTDLVADSRHGAAVPVPGGYDRNGWHKISLGDVQAICLDAGYMYAVAFDKLAVIDKGIFRQPLNTMNPYSSWTLIGYGGVSSIAIHTGSGAKTMYGVGSSHWLYKQDLANMSADNTWTVASVFPLSSIAIAGNSIYGVSPDHPGIIFSTSLDMMVEHSAWSKAGKGAVKSLTVAHGTFFAIFDNDAVYNKILAGAESDENGWTLKDQSGMISIAVLGDTMYGVREDHVIYRKPLTLHKRWGRAAKGPMVHLAIGPSGDVIYGVHEDGRVYTQDLMRLGVNTTWNPASAAGQAHITSVAIQGNIIYAVGQDMRVYKQYLNQMTTSSEWHLGSACCVSQIATADLIIYGVGKDKRVYQQAEAVMTADSQWIPASIGNGSSLAIRGDTIYAIDTHGFTFEQRLSTMTTNTSWNPTFFEDALYPSRKYLSIMAHNDIMYACGQDMVVYTKLIKKPITYPPHLVTHRNTHGQALHWNLTDLSHTTRSPVPLTTRAPAWHRATTPAQPTREALDIGPTTPSTTTEAFVEAGVMNHYVDRFQDAEEAAAGADTVNFTALQDTVQKESSGGINADDATQIQNRAGRGANVSCLWHAVIHSCVFLLALPTLG